MKLIIKYKGGSGSGFHDHAGRPGKVGGSQEESGQPAKDIILKLATDTTQAIVPGIGSVEIETAPLVAAMNNNGYKTTESCGGELNDQDATYGTHVKFSSEKDAKKFYDNIVKDADLQHTWIRKGTLVGPDWSSQLSTTTKFLEFEEKMSNTSDKEYKRFVSGVTNDFQKLTRLVDPKTNYRVQTAAKQPKSPFKKGSTIKFSTETSVGGPKKIVTGKVYDILGSGSIRVDAGSGILQLVRPQDVVKH